MSLADDLCKIGKSLAERNFVHYLLGTISARSSENPHTYLVKPAECLYELANPSDFALVNEDGDPVDGTDRRPSLNFLVHLACYRARPDIGGVVHAHPEKTTALISQDHPAFNGIPSRIPLLTQEGVWMVKNWHIPIVEDLDPKELAEAVSEKILEANVVAIRNHGIIAVGKSIWEAYGAALVAESEAVMLGSIISMGGKPLIRNPETGETDLCKMPSRTFSKKFT